MRIDLCGEDFEHGRERPELLGKPEDSFPSTALDQFYTLINKESVNKGGEGVPCKNRGKNEIINTKKILMMQRLIQSKTGTRL